MRYLTRFSGSSSERVRSIVDMNWGIMRDWIHLIASTSYPFPAVMAALAEPMCIVPIEGLPGSRYFPGTYVMDAVEKRAEELLCSLFASGQNYCATIQPHSGTQANQIVYNACLSANDIVLSLAPAEGGHISHKVLIGRQNEVVFYHLGEDARIDYRALEDVAQRLRPKLIIAGGSAYPREIDFESIGAIAHSAGALFHADISHTATFVAAGVHAPVAPHADFISFNTVKNMRGPNSGVLLYRMQYRDAVARGLFPTTQGGANENMMFAKLVALEELAKIDLRTYALSMIDNARNLGRTLAKRGLTVVTGGTDSHLLLVDLGREGMTGAAAERACEHYRVLVNRNLVPNDTRSASVSSGVRLGSACITILNYSDADVMRLGNWLADRFTGTSAGDPSALISELTGHYNRSLIPD